MSICFEPIGLIHSEHLEAANTPIQPVYATDCLGSVEVFPEYAAGLRDLQLFSHLYLLYFFDKAEPAKLIVKPFLQDIERGVFSTRVPCRPNPIGMSVVELLGIEGNVLKIKGCDILDGTPLLDIKPYTAKFDRHETRRNGWQDEVDDATAAVRGRRGYQGGRQ